MPTILKLTGRTPDQIPVLETERLRLRAHAIDDLDEISAIWADDRFVRYIGRRNRSRPEVWKTIQSMIGSWALLGYGYWVIEHRTTREFIGEIGFLEGIRPIEPSHQGIPEAGWGIAPKHWGQGYASEALDLVGRWGDAEFPDKRTVCMIEDDHAASIRVAEKCGYKFAYNSKIDTDPVRIFERMGA